MLRTAVRRTPVRSLWKQPFQTQTGTAYPLHVPPTTGQVATHDKLRNMPQPVEKYGPLKWFRDFCEMSWYMGPTGLKGAIPVVLFCGVMISGIWFNNIRKQQTNYRYMKLERPPRPAEGEFGHHQPWQVVRATTPHDVPDGSHGGPADH